MEEEKTKIDFLRLFGVIIGAHYHAFDMAIQTANKAYEMYIDTPKEEREANWELASIVAKHMNPPIPIESYMPNYLERKYQKN